jgi:hypothetical protein
MTQLQNKREELEAQTAQPVVPRQGVVVAGGGLAVGQLLPVGLLTAFGDGAARPSSVPAQTRP